MSTYNLFSYFTYFFFYKNIRGTHEKGILFYVRLYVFLAVFYVHLMRNARKEPFCNLWKTQAQISLQADQGLRCLLTELMGGRGVRGRGHIFITTFMKRT